MIGRELIKYILENHMEDAEMVLRRVKNTEYEVWQHIKPETIVRGNGILIFEHQDINWIDNL